MNNDQNRGAMNWTDLEKHLNRVFHHEPLLWLTPALIDQHTLGLQAIGWLDPQLIDWLNHHDRLPVAWQSGRTFRPYSSDQAAPAIGVKP
ncbi:MAG TPA: hypothetical protein VFA14_05230 [Herbaspirillum sp.]|nr:hypothetical protein [Herbaspirillum sp.]